MEIALAVLITAIIVGAVVALILRRPHPKPEVDLVQMLQAAQQQNLQIILEQLNRNQQSHDRNSTMVHTRIDQATKVVGEVQNKLSQLEEANKRIFELGKDISGLQDILRAPKLRGTMGEIWLAELIGQMIPKENYRLQHRFSSGEICDAVILLRDGLMLSIDAKFSLENFSKLIKAPETEWDVYKKQFASDVKKRVDEIAKKYILPHEGTLEFAFMYVPAENVYYHAFIQEEDNLHLLQYAFERKVIPVSPSSFYAYLQLIFFGLRGLEIEKSAKEIHQQLVGLKGEFGKFRDVYARMGNHLKNVQNSYEESDKKLGTIETKFFQLNSSEPVKAVESESNESRTE
jgi:DNA recombination protein RmuC